MPQKNLPSFARRLNSWYRRNARDLPWRRTKDPYLIWISEVMLQQTTVKAVVPYFERWKDRFPNVGSVAECDEQELLKMWQGLGYYQRARNLHKAAKVIVSDFDGVMPDKESELANLPGFGPYTIGAVLSIAFDKRVSIVDANVRRVFMRWLGMDGKATVSQDSRIKAVLQELMPQKNLRTFNQALMELGALICKNKEPVCNACPVRSDCVAFAEGRQEIIPEKEKKEFVTLEVAIGVANRDDRFFIQQRSKKGLLAGLWEFPGGKIEAGETAKVALKRELMEELNVEVANIRPYLKTRHYYTKYKVNLHVFTCDFKSEPRSEGPSQWISRSQFEDFPMPSGSAKIVDKILSEC